MISTEGMVHTEMRHSVEEALARLQGILQSKGIPIFALIDHSGEAARSGLEMPPTKLLIFGNPKAGTPLMLAAPTVALDLPLKILLWQDPQGKKWISYNTPQYLVERHHLPPDLAGNIRLIETLAATLASEP